MSEALLQCLVACVLRGVLSSEDMVDLWLDVLVEHDTSSADAETVGTMLAVSGFCGCVCTTTSRFHVLHTDIDYARCYGRGGAAASSQTHPQGCSAQHGAWHTAGHGAQQAA